MKSITENQKELPSQQGHLFFLVESFLYGISKLCLHLPIKGGSLFEDNTDKLTSKYISNGGWGWKFKGGS